MVFFNCIWFWLICHFTHFRVIPKYLEKLFVSNYSANMPSILPCLPMYCKYLRNRVSKIDVAVRRHCKQLYTATKQMTIEVLAASWLLCWLLWWWWWVRAKSLIHSLVYYLVAVRAKKVKGSSSLKRGGHIGPRKKIQLFLGSNPKGSWVGPKSATAAL